mmetsp:Transcript_6210/g.8654  ORF Transcript_6210/g.8654 Transcript_6210/m.8654 type:complete len:448 (+) Transcript_6210:162-1505(+)
MKTLVNHVIDPPPVQPTPTIAVTSEAVAKAAEEKGLGYQDLMEADEDVVGEKLQSEIEKFRMRQKIRDVELEEQRRQKIKNKIKQLNEAKLHSEKNPLAPASSNGEDNTNVTSATSRGQDESSTRKRTERPKTDVEDLETKRRRKLEVLQMLSDDADISELTAEFAPAAPPAPPVFVPPPAAPGPLKLLSFNTATTTTATVKVLKRSVGEDEEEESKPKREFVPLDFGEDQLPPTSTTTTTGAAASVVETVLQRHLQQQLQQIEDDDDDEELDGDGDGGVFKKNMNKRKNLMQLAANTATAIPDSVQAKVLAQAQAISAALASGSKPQSTTTTSSTVVDKKEALKKLVDNIPTKKEDLFSYAVNWKMVDEYDLIQSVMRPWIVKKIIEYLGEEEESLTSFMVSKLQAHCQPGDLLEELSMVLDEDSEQFVLKLWRMLIYHSLRVAMK